MDNTNKPTIPKGNAFPFEGSTLPTPAQSLHDFASLVEVSDAEAALLSAFQSIRRAEQSREEYSNFAAWNHLEQMVRDVLDDRSILHEHDEDITIARTVAAWMHAKRGNAKP